MKPKLLDGVHYLHLRHYDERGRPCGKGGMTLAWEIIDDTDRQFRIKIGRSICSEKDMFWRKRGREIAHNRLVLPTSSIRVGICIFPTHGEIVTRSTLKEDIHEDLNRWAYGTV